MWRIPLFEVVSQTSSFCPTVQDIEGRRNKKIFTDSKIAWPARSARRLPRELRVLPDDPVNGVLEAIGHITTHLGLFTFLNHLSEQISGSIRHDADGEIMLLYPFPRDVKPELAGICPQHAFGASQPGAPKNQLGGKGEDTNYASRRSKGPWDRSGCA